MPGKISIPSQELAALLGVESVAPGGNLKDEPGVAAPAPAAASWGRLLLLALN
jgi:hypothetical protein